MLPSTIAFRTLLLGVLGLSFGSLGAAADEARPTTKVKLEPRIPAVTKVKSPGAILAMRPDLYIAGTADLTDITVGGSLHDRMWVKVGNKGLATASNIRVHIYFWTLKNSGGTVSGKIYHTRVMTIASLKPGKTVKLQPYDASVPGSPISWSVKIDPSNAIKELREDNNRTGRMWTTYPDAFLRAYSYEAAP